MTSNAVTKSLKMIFFIRLWRQRKRHKLNIGKIHLSDFYFRTLYQTYQEGVKIDSTIHQIQIDVVLSTSIEFPMSVSFFSTLENPLFFTGWQAEKRASDRHRNFRIPHGVLMLEGAYYPSDVTDTITTKKNSLHLIWSHKKFLSDTQIARFSASSSLCLEIKMTTLMTNKPRGHELPRLKMWLKLPSDSQILEIPFENSTNG